MYIPISVFHNPHVYYVREYTINITLVFVDQFSKFAFIMFPFCRWLLQGAVEHLKANCPEKLQNQVKNERKHMMPLTYSVLISKRKLHYRGVVHTTLDTGI